MVTDPDRWMHISMSAQPDYQLAFAHLSSSRCRMEYILFGLEAPLEMEALEWSGG